MCGKKQGMPKLDERTEQQLKEFASRLAQLWGDDLAAIVLYGSGAGRHYLPDISDLNVLIVPTRVTPERLRQLSQLLKFFRRLPLDPIVLGAREIAQLAEAYPIEAAEIGDRRRVLYGEDPFSSLSVPPEALQRQLIGELLGKTLRLRELYLDAVGDVRRLERTLSGLVSAYGALLRALLRVVEPRYPPPEEYLEAVTQAEERLGLELAGLREAYQVKLGTHRLLKEELQALFERVLDETESLTERAFQLRKGTNRERNDKGG